MAEARIGPQAQPPTRLGAGWSGVASRLSNLRKKQAPAGDAAEAEELFDLSKIAGEPACQKLASSPAGLTFDEAAQRLKTYGLNLVTRERQPTIAEEIWSRSKIRSTRC